MPVRIARTLVAFVAAILILEGGSHFATAQAPTGIQTPEQFFGFRIGADNKLARWDKIVDYMRQVDAAQRSRPDARARASPRTTIRSSRSRSARPTR